MKSLSGNITARKNQITDTQPWLLLVDLVLPDESATLRYVNNPTSVTYGGNTYSPFAFHLEEVDYNRNELQSVALYLCNINRVLQPYVAAQSGLRGATVTITQVNAGLLAEDYSNDAMTFKVMHCQNSLEWVVLHLGAPSPLNERFPPSRYLGMQCRSPFKGALCGYSGAGTSCHRNLTACRAYSNSPAYGGFGALRNGSLRLAFG